MDNLSSIKSITKLSLRNGIWFGLLVAFHFLFDGYHGILILLLFPVDQEGQDNSHEAYEGEVREGSTPINILVKKSSNNGLQNDANDPKECLNASNVSSVFWG